MKVFKFGGASVNSIDRIKGVANILEAYTGQPLMVIVSAMGKTTNALEKVVEAFYHGHQQEALQLFEAIKQSHLTTAKYLLVKTYNQALNNLVNIFTEAEWLLHDKPVRSFDYYYDQVVCVGELLSTCIVNAYLNERGIASQLIDVRDLLRTNDNFRDADVDFSVTQAHIEAYFKAAPMENRVYMTQGFVGSTDANESTTLGREGSDYTAAIFANLLNAESLTIWKDVEGVMNADPKQFANAEWLSELSYAEVIEMAYYGAQVIHPKTIKPLQNKQIPLYVKSFLNPAVPGTVISRTNGKNLPPIKILKQHQVLLHMRTHDFSFVGEQPMSDLYEIFSNLHVKPNLLQTGAINIQLCIDDHTEKLEAFAAACANLFDVQVEKGLTLLTIRHFSQEVLTAMTAGKKLVLLQQTTDTVQALYHEEVQ